MRGFYLNANAVMGPVPTELELRAARHELFLHLYADEMTESQQEWSEPCPAVGPSPNLRCDKEVLLAVRDRLRGEHRELLRTWHLDNSIHDFEGVSVNSGDGVADVVGLHWIGWWPDPPGVGTAHAPAGAGLGGQRGEAMTRIWGGGKRSRPSTAGLGTGPVATRARRCRPWPHPGWCSCPTPPS